MARLTYYNQNTHSVIIQGVSIRDFYEGEDVIAWEPQGDLITATRGLDRNAISVGSGRPGALTLRLKPTSRSIIFLQELAEIGGNFRLVGALVTTGVEDVLALIDAAVEDMGFQTGGPTMQARVFKLTAANYTLTETIA